MAKNATLMALIPLLLLSCAKEPSIAFNEPVGCETLFDNYSGPSRGWCTGIGQIVPEDQRVYFPDSNSTNSFHIYDAYWIEDRIDMLSHGAKHRIKLKFEFMDGDNFAIANEIFSIVEVRTNQDSNFTGIAEIYFNYWDATSIISTDAEDVQKSFRGWASFDDENAELILKAVDQLQFSITPEGESLDARAVLILTGKVGTKIVTRRFVADRFSVCEMDTHNCATSTPEFRDEITEIMAPYMRK